MIRPTIPVACLSYNGEFEQTWSVTTIVANFVNLGLLHFATSNTKSYVVKTESTASVRPVARRMRLRTADSNAD
jgi:hypothetical protein